MFIFAIFTSHFETRHRKILIKNYYLFFFSLKSDFLELMNFFVFFFLLAIFCLFVCRVFVLVMVAVSVAWVPMIQNMQGGQLYVYIQSIAADLSPPVAAVYLVAIFWRRANEQVRYSSVWGYKTKQNFEKLKELKNCK